MSDASNAVVALKNAWSGAVIAADAVRAIAPDVAALPAEAGFDGLDFERYARLTLANANAAQALRGLIEELRRKHDAAVV